MAPAEHNPGAFVPPEPALVAIPSGSVGSIVRARRRGLGLSLAALAERAGCAASYLSSVETGSRGAPKAGVLGALERALGLGPGVLVEAAAWEATPEVVRRAYRRLAAEREVIAGVVRGRGVDEAYRSGELARVLGSLAGEGRGAVVASDEVPVVGGVTTVPGEGEAGGGEPAAGVCVRCPGVGDGEAFAACVWGDGMEPRFRAGDVVVFSPARAVSEGDDCFVRLVGGGALFVRVYREGGGVRLQPTNARHAAVVVEPERVRGTYRAVRVVREV